MVRHYKRKPGRVNPAKRMARAAELRAEGLSRKQIAERLSCSIRTVFYDLKQWDALHSNVSPLCKDPMQKLPPGGENCIADLHSDQPNIISLSDRKKRA